MTNTIIGYPYIGERRKWKSIVESFWKQQLHEDEFTAKLQQLRQSHLQKQQKLGLDFITVGDFTYYDRMLDTAVMFGLVPRRYNWNGKQVDLATYYAMARGQDDVVACEMTKWFNTNYHYIVPEYEGQTLQLTNNFILQAYNEAKALHINAKPTLIGPFTFSRLTKGYDKMMEAGFMLQLVPLYIEVIESLVAAGAEWIQLEEPSLVTSLTAEEIALAKQIYENIAEKVPTAKIMLQTYFEALTHYEDIVNLPVSGIGLDFANGYQQNLANLRQFGFPQDKVLAIGIINGREIWRADLADKYSKVQAITTLAKTTDIWLQSSCSLQHVPVTTAYEINLDNIVKDALAFADEKIIEIVHLTRYIKDNNSTTKQIISESMQAVRALNEHAVRHNAQVQREVAAIAEADFTRATPFTTRQQVQNTKYQLPLFPTTTIGSFPQSQEVKQTRSKWRKKEISNEDYAKFVEEETARWIAIQEDLGVDVLVHGEFERTDMVEYFGEKLAGFAFTKNGWVVSYGSRCVKPPIIYGDVAWQAPMTVKETAFAQNLTKHYVKGMLTGPVTILNWSFVRDDLTRQQIAYQIALALKHEIEALEKSGITIIQVDEPALREGLPLHDEDVATYIDWGVKAFKLATSGVADDTQIHTHMCYCEFNDFMGPISALDADVISIETSRSHGELIEALRETPYAQGIGLGVYDIHSPRVPEVAEMYKIMNDSLAVLQRNQFWVNPDCGLKTRGEKETVAALANMVEAATQLRSNINK